MFDDNETNIGLHKYYDFMFVFQISDGYTELKLSGSIENDIINTPSGSEYLFVTFVSDIQTTQDGFQITYSELSDRKCCIPKLKGG